MKTQYDGRLKAAGIKVCDGYISRDAAKDLTAEEKNELHNQRWRGLRDRRLSPLSRARRLASRTPGLLADAWSSSSRSAADEGCLDPNYAREHGRCR